MKPDTAPGGATDSAEAEDVDELTYPLGAASRLTGVSPDLLRAWERRYGVVMPVRTPGGTRRYRARDLERLRLLKACVDGGHRIGSLVGLDSAELQRRAVGKETSSNLARPASAALRATLDALGRLDAPEAERLMSLQLATLGPVPFARSFALPLLREIGDRWSNDTLCIAAEHLGTSLLRVILGSALRPSSAALRGPTIVFATPPGERHELGLQMAALTAMGAGANPLYLGSELPIDDLLHAASLRKAAAVAVSLVTVPPRPAEEALRALCAGLPAHTELWAGGPLLATLSVPARTVQLGDFDALEQRVEILKLR